MALAQPFTTPSPTIASYSWTDLLTNQGYKTLYLLEILKETATADYLLFSMAVPSNTIVIDNTTTSATLAKVTDLDFDMTVETPNTIKGLAIVSGIYGLSSSDGSGIIGHAKIVAKLYLNGVLLDEGETGSLAIGPPTAQREKFFSIQLTIPQTYINKGDVLRLTMEAWGDRTVGTPGQTKVGLGIDPSGRNNPDEIYPSITTGNSTQLRLFLPFKILKK